jgi:hypothetical protein
MATLLRAIVAVFFQEDLFHAGVSSDGFPLIGNRFSIIAETASGHRFAHPRTFCSGKLIEEDTEDGFLVYWQQDIDADRLLAESFVKRVEEVLLPGSSLGDSWVPVQGRYGSPGWSEEEEIAREREEDFA